MIGNVLDKMIEYFSDDIKRINHSLKVYGFAKAIAAGEKVAGQTLETLETAAILHDIGIHEAERRHNSTAGEFQELEGPPIARVILKELDVDDIIADRICKLVGSHHSYSKIDGIDFQILVEADFLVNINEDNLPSDSARTIKNNRVIFKINENDYRLIAEINYHKGWVFIKFIGTHAEYDKIVPETVNFFKAKNP